MALQPQARIGDKTLGHWVGIFYYPPTALIEGSPDTFSCCLPASRVGDAAAEHFAWILGIVPLPALKHKPTAAIGDPVVLINYRQAFRVGDTYDCGDTQAEGCVTNLKCG